MTRKNSRPPKKRNTHRRKNQNPTQRRQRFHIEVVITSKVVPHLREYPVDGFKYLAKCQCEVDGPNGGAAYTLYIDREQYASKALRLSPGTRVILPDATFQPNPRYRDITELHARRLFLPSEIVEE